MPATYAPSSNIADLAESATIAVSARAKALRARGRPVIDLGAGEPDFPTPAFICEAAKRALDAGATRYTQVEGMASLREAVVALANEHLRSGPPIAANEVVVTTGTKQALFNACFTLFGAGDEVLVPTPAWTSYYEMLTLARARAVPVRGSRSRSLKVGAADLDAAASPRTRGVILNSPTNPTGAVYDEEELIAIVDLAAKRGWWLLSDEIYRRISYDGRAPSVLNAVHGDGSSRARVVVVDGVAKSYAMTGWRIGWAIAPAEVARAMAALQSHTTSNATTVSQHAALAALTQREEADRAVDAMVAEFRRRRDAGLAILCEADVDVIAPLGAFYFYLRVGDATEHNTEPGTAFARKLLETRDVAIVPGAAFRSPEWVRVSYAAPLEDVLEGARRIVSELRG
jgi:aspartate aminotransferase